MMGVQFGQSTRRREDDRLVTGRGEYTSDTAHADALHAVFVRSPHAAATVRSVDIEAARAHPGVVAVLTAADMYGGGFNDCPAPFKFPQQDGTFALETPRPFLVRDRVRFLGEPVAMVLAESAAAAQDAAELVVVDYEEQRPVTDVASASQPGALQLWDDRPGNLAYYWRKGDFDAIDAALARSHHVVRLKSRISRVSALPLEPRAALAYIDEEGRPVLRASHQSPHLLRNDLATLFGLQHKDLRVIAADVGGSFGMKMGIQREEVLVFWAARLLRRAVRWTALRSECFLSDDQARDVDVHTELGLDADGKFTALRVRYAINVGAYMCWRSTTPINNFGGIAGVYTTPLIGGEALGYFTNTQITAAYRGAGRPDATYAVERVIDVAAAELGIDPAELRRRNLIPPSAMPYKTPFLLTYDCGEFERNLDKALELVRYDDFPARRAESQRRGRLRGIGIAMPIEIASGPSTDWASIRAHPDGSVTLYSGAMSVGQGLDTTLSTVVANSLGLPLSKVRYVQGDTDQLAFGRGNGGSAALTICGAAIVRGIEELLEKGRLVAAAQLEAAKEDIQFSEGAFRVVGTDRVVTLADVARVVEQVPQSDSTGLMGSGQFTPQAATFPNGCHICEVEVDPGTGAVSVLNYVGVEDVGRVLNPMLVEGQTHGGVVQAIGQALMEELRFDETGQLLTGSLMDYALPRAGDVCNMLGANPETPTALNPLGVKGVGEAGTVGGLSATMNAVCNALQAAGVRHIDMPATPTRVWEALRAAGYPASGAAG